MGFVPTLSLQRRGGMLPVPYPAPAALLKNLFTAADGTQVIAHAPDLGPAFTQLEGLAADTTIIGNRMDGSQAAQSNVVSVVAQSGKADVFLSLTANFPSADALHGIGIILRATDALNYWLAWLTGDGALTLYAFVAGAFTAHGASAPAITAGKDYCLQAVAVGSTITIKVDEETSVVTYASAAFNQTATKHGIRMYTSSGTPAVNQRGDDFLVADSPPAVAKVLTIIGDSIGLGFPGSLALDWNGGNVTLKDHAVGGAAVEFHMAGQVAAAAGDAADLIIVELGTNDGTGSQQAIYQAGLASLHANNPKAALYAMGVLDRVGAADSDRLLKEAWIKAAADALGVKFWPAGGWIDPTAGVDTSDGTHPNAHGRAKIAARIMALI